MIIVGLHSIHGIDSNTPEGAGEELTPRNVDFAQLDTVVEELVNSTA